MDNKTITDLPLVACILIDLPDGGIDCSVINQTQCIRCPFLGRFISGETMDIYSGPSHIACLVLGVFTMLIGIWGTFANIVIITILGRRKSGRSFDTFLIVLASFDLVCSLTAVISGVSTIIYFQNWDRGFMTLVAWYFGTFTMLLSRSGSSFMTVMITIERFIVVSFPMSSVNWFTKSMTRNLSIFVSTFAILMAIPRYSSIYIGENTAGKHAERTKDLEYMFSSTRLEKVWYHDAMGFFDWIDFWAPLPLLLIFNVLTYFNIRRFTARRKDLNLKHRKDIRAARMFIPVVIVLFLCNIEPIIHYYFIFNMTVYREAYLGMCLSFAVNAAVNLPIYYFRGTFFRREATALLGCCWKSLGQGNSSNEYNVELRHSKRNTISSGSYSRPISKYASGAFF